MHVPNLPVTTTKGVYFRTLGGCAGLVLIGYFLTRDALPVIRGDAEVFAPYASSRMWLWMHVVGSASALVAGPLQLLTGSSTTFQASHRAVGLIYIAGIAIGATGALNLVFHSAVGWTLSFALVCLNVIWIVATAMGWLAARRKHTTLHRQWMIRSYIMTFGFVTFRLLADLPLFPADATFAERVTASVWASWVLPIMAAEVAFSWRRVLARSSVSTTTRSSEMDRVLPLSVESTRQ